MRTASLTRNTFETKITCTITLEEGVSSIQTGIGFFDHMLTLMAKHGRFTLELEAEGDLEVDTHHTVEDIGIVMGQAFRQALGDRKGLVRYGTTFTPMDEALARVCTDLGGRYALVYDVPILRDRVGDFESETMEEFFIAFAQNAKINLHIATLYGRNQHHLFEAVFKGIGRALKEACTIDPTIDGYLSTKGVIE